MRRLAFLLVPFAFAACHPAACFYPPELPSGDPLELPSDGAYPKDKVEVFVDDKGIPHIYGESEADLSYALGFMHGKDRQWQVLSTKLGVYGRLSEVLGESALAQDQRARMIVYGLDAQYEATSERDKEIFTAYADGVNAGAAFAGPSIEMKVLGAEWEKFQPKDVLTVIRYFAWDLSAGLYDELSRNRIAHRIAEDDPRYPWLMGTVWSGESPVVASTAHSGLVGFNNGDALDGPGEDRRLTTTNAPTPRPMLFKPGIKGKAKRQPVSDRVREIFDFSERGASNVWAVSGAATASGNAVMAHDPHLRHSGPGLFYLVHLEGPDFTIAGGSAPGAPGILLGHGKHVAWGTPVSNVDSQDLVRITPFEGRPDLYLLDGKPHAYDTITQTYRLGSDEDAEVFTEEWQVTVFGPVLPDSWASEFDDGDIFAFMWPGHSPIEQSGSVVGGLWDLAKANNKDEATAAIQKITQPPITMGMAFDDGTIAYRLAGDIPVRISDEPVTLPRDGRYSTAGWLGRLPPDYKPQLTDPTELFYVAANQRIVENYGPQARIIGEEGADPYRAMRIRERLEALLAGDVKPTTDEILAIQQDVESPHARDLAPIYGRHCPPAVSGVDENSLRAVCRSFQQFDGVFSNDSKGALVFTWMDREIRRQVLMAHFDEEDVVNQIRDESWMITNFHLATRAEDRGEEPALFDDVNTPEREGLRHFIGLASKVVVANLDDTFDSPATWRYGALHKLSFSWALSAIPVVGNMLFSTPAIEEPGCGSCPRAERGRESTKEAITNGAVLRIAAEMSDPPVVRITNDTGNSGHFGHRHSMNMNEAWSTGKPIVLVGEKADFESNAEGKVNFLPKP